MGDPAGIGPEVALEAANHSAVRKACRLLLIGDRDLLARTNQGANDWPLWNTGPIPDTGDAWIHSLTQLPKHECVPGQPSQSCGEACYRYIHRAVELIRAGVVDAMATAPISKKNLQQAGYPYPGHTELLAELTDTREVRMMLWGRRLRVVLVTVHLPLAEVMAALTRKRIRITIELTHRSLEDWFGLANPRLAVAALNPHGGEDGIFGHEEKRLIQPAAEDCRRKGIDVSGPVPSDSLFHRAARGEYDAVVCMYHDQGLGPFKLLHFTNGVNLTLGLPIVRTSVDHGTAYDIAGKGVADSTSMKEAILLAAKLAKRRKRGRLA
jgi:4-phospho-D-threonate 3-dehydrogenase / 4-phospho-D-erythronate 3-dehydrogenase